MATTALRSFVLLFAAVPAACVRQRGGIDDTSVDDAPPSSTGRYFVITEVYEIDVDGESLRNVGAKVDSLLEERDNAGDFGSAGSDGETGSKTSAFYHSEVVFCDRKTMNDDQIEYLTDIMLSMDGYTETEPKFWQNATDVECTTLSFGGGTKSEDCSGVSHFKQKLSDIRAGISKYYRNDATKVWKYVYGTTDKTSHEVKKAECESCGSSWASSNYDAVLRNCNYWSKKILWCQLGLAGDLPWLSVSNMRPLLNCNC